MAASIKWVNRVPTYFEVSINVKRLYSFALRRLNCASCDRLHCASDDSATIKHSTIDQLVASLLAGLGHQQ